MSNDNTEPELSDVPELRAALASLKDQEVLLTQVRRLTADKLTLTEEVADLRREADDRRRDEERRRAEHAEEFARRERELEHKVGLIDTETARIRVLDKREADLKAKEVAVDEEIERIIGSNEAVLEAVREGNERVDSIVGELRAVISSLAGALTTAE